ncbi:hypothetical protein [Falsiroseomonas sp. CW058]|uniref:hypothetical protein n=1 Tax=Falsiroseomonas sp. CW058 TaxID=3388664 RepID=UPI003D310257
MDVIDAVVDHCIRRGLGFAGLAIGTVMLALSFDLVLALRVGADMLGLTAVVLLVAAWRAPHRDHRRSEAWAELSSFRPDFAGRLPRPEAQRLLSEAMRRRLVWHAERIGAVAVTFWAIALVAGLLRG